jgi:glutamate carboxypeptidase
MTEVSERCDACYAAIVAESSEALAWLTEERRPELEAELRTLVEISSHTSDRGGVDAVAAALETLLAARCPSLRCERVSGGSFGDHLLARTAAEGPRVLLVGHHDTVFPAQVFSGCSEDGALLRGPGVLDMKGGLVVIAFALAALDRVGLLDTLPITLVSVSDEEVGSPHSRTLLLRECADARAALVFESGRAEDRIITRRKGTGAARVEVSGKAAHAGNAHQDGVNAIWAVARFVDRAQRLTDYARGVTVNVGRVEGGMGKNTVPDAAVAELDLRYLTRADGAALVDALGEACREAERDVPGSRMVLTASLSRRPLERTEASGQLAALYARAAAQEGLGTEEAPLLGGGSDANTVAERGVPAIDGLGPRGKGFHTTGEQIERASLIPKTRALVRALLELNGR